MSQVAQVSCQRCGPPERLLWTYGSLPALQNVCSGNYIALQQCQECLALWCAVPHEPYLSFTFVTRWPYDTTTWKQIHEIEDGLVLHEWHDAVIRENWQSLSAGERVYVEDWRKRTSYGHNPIDRGPSIKAPKRVRTAADLKRFVATG